MKYIYVIMEKNEKESPMEPKDYIITKIEGEYAYLREVNGRDEEIFIALYLLPLGVDIGTKLHYEWLTYTIVD